MRILYIHQFFATRESDLGLIRSYEFSRRWVEAGHEVTVVTSSSRLPAHYSQKLFSRGEVDGIQVRSVRVSYSNYMSYPRRIGSFLLFTMGAIVLSLGGSRPDVVFATSTPLTVGIPGWIAAALRRAPFVFEVRDLWPEAAIQMGAFSRTSLLSRVAKGMERFLYRRAAHIIALSPGMVDGVIAEGIEADRVHMIPNSADLDMFQPAEKDPDFVSRFGLEGRFVVGYAGAIGPTNAVEAHVPQAARILRERGRSDIVFVIAGDGKCLPALVEAKERDGLDNVLLIGSLPKKEIPVLTRSSDALMTLFADVPILATNSPNKFFDALASGRPVIVNQPGWTRELVQENEAGIAVPAGDPEALADAVMTLADDAGLVRRMGANARALAEKRFGRDDLAAQVLSVLASAVDGREGPTR